MNRELSKLNDLKNKFEKPSQTFKVDTDKPRSITGKEGTRIFINPNDLITESGKPVGPDIEVELKELTKQSELLLSNAQTVSDGELLISGGAYYIQMTSSGETLKLKEGKTLKVQFPNISKREMKLYYGERNQLGLMNWKETNIKFVPSKQLERPKLKDTVIIKKQQKSDIDAILDYVDSGYNPTPEEKKKNIDLRKNIEIATKVYEEIGLDKMEWINCDIELSPENATNLYVNFYPEDSVKYSNVYLVFKDINSVIQSYYFSEDPPIFKNLPTGYNAKLIAYTVRGSKVFGFSQDIKISKDQKITVKLKELNEREFKTLLSK
ncbi:MAG: hypothetical protein MUE71_01430 [Chitinophagaceae bacterium]|nr:hypothetical protein [Chitinophagaceae bacterium]